MFSRISRYLHDVRNELRKVIWPTRQETVVFTAVVLVSVFIVAMVIWGFDFVIGGFMSLLIG